MKKLFTLFYIFSSIMIASDSVLPHDEEYFKYEDNNVEIIYTKDNLPFAKHTAGIENALNKDYEKLFNWKLDETLYVGLISHHNQIANGFSSQWPNNRQINYIGGTQLIDSFCSISWLDTLLYHETAHNYQTNVKGSSVSRFLHSIFGNGNLFDLLPMSVPNVMENSFLLEGNAVLNESWHGNGGRLYSGRYKAETILQAKAGKITPGEVYNVKLEFPYSGDIWYIQGGFYNLYLAEKYGIENVNSYYKFHSEDFFWPQFTNASMKQAIGVDFEDSLADFSKEYAMKNLVLAEGHEIAKSQFFYSLGSDAKEIYFLTNKSGYDVPELNIINKKDTTIKKVKDSFISGKVIKAGESYYTQASAKTSITKIYQGLFNSSGFIKDGTESKMVQGYLRDGRAVYFDVPSSFSQARLYVGNKFFAQVNSSVFIDKFDNLYYFKQTGKKRVLYKNKKALFYYEGFYGIVSDVDSRGGIYFIANTKNGSSLFKYYNKKLIQVSKADNIIEAKLINDKYALLAAINDKEYYYVVSKLHNFQGKLDKTELFFENKEYYGKYSYDRTKHEQLDLSNSYNALLDMHYSGSDLMLFSSGNTVYGSLYINFEDPLSQNSFSAYINRDEQNTTISGINYSNSQYIFEYSLGAYKTFEKNNYQNLRDSGFYFDSVLSLYEAGYYSSSIGIQYYQDYQVSLREPLSINLSFLNHYRYGISMYENYLNSVDIFASKLEDDIIYGAKVDIQKHLFSELYFGFEAKKSVASAEAATYVHGVKVSSSLSDFGLDPSAINIPSMVSTYYFKDVAYAEANLNKVINLSSYWFTFPVSMQREALYMKYRYYDMQYYDEKRYNFSEITAGLALSTVMLNKGVVPMNFEYIYNDSSFILDDYRFRFTIGLSF